jgi:hypothetical protein
MRFGVARRHRDWGPAGRQSRTRAADGPVWEHHRRHGQHRPTGARPQAVIQCRRRRRVGGAEPSPNQRLGHHRLGGRNGSLGRTDVDEARKERAARAPNAEPARSG